MRPTWLVLLVLITLAAALLRLAQADESLWLDELHTAWAAMGPADEIALRAQFGNQSPLYFYLVRGAVSCFGRNEIALRLPSLLAGIALVPLVAWLTLCWTDDRIASLTAAILVSVDHYCLFYSQEARPYAIVQFARLGAGGLFLEATCWDMGDAGAWGWSRRLSCCFTCTIRLPFSCPLNWSRMDCTMPFIASGYRIVRHNSRSI